MASLSDTIRLIAAGKKQLINEADAMQAMQAQQPTVAGAGNMPPANTGPQGGAPEEPDMAGMQVVQAELILIADRSQKIAAMVGQSGVVDPMLQTQITGIASDISQLYADLMMAQMPDPNADPNAPQGGQPPAGGSSQVNTNPKVAEETEKLEELFGLKANPAISAAADSLKKKPAGEKPDLKMPGVREPQDKIKREENEVVDEAVAQAPDDHEDENEHIIMQLHKSVTLGGKKIVKFASGQKVKVDPKMAYKALQKFGSMKPLEKQKAQEYLRQSHQNLMSFVKEDFSLEEENLNERVIAAEPHIIDQLTAASKTTSGKEIEFENGQKVNVPPNMAKKLVEKFASLSPYKKQELQHYIRASYANLIRAARG